jgi:heme/copper-type cytochrome/quinol oxidase subunit 1
MGQSPDAVLKIFHPESSEVITHQSLIVWCHDFKRSPNDFATMVSRVTWIIAVNITIKVLSLSQYHVAKV